MFELAIVFTLAVGNIEVDRMYTIDTSSTQEELDYGKCFTTVEILAKNKFEDILRDGEEFKTATCVVSKFIQR